MSVLAAFGWAYNHSRVEPLLGLLFFGGSGYYFYFIHLLCLKLVKDKIVLIFLRANFLEPNILKRPPVISYKLNGRMGKIAYL